MNLRMMNESFKRKYSDCINESIDDSDKAQLKKALIMRSMNVIANGGNIKALEIALQEVIENFYPDHCWWEVTDCQIFNELLAGTKPREVCEMIVDQLKPEFAGNTEESISENIDSQDHIGANVTINRSAKDYFSEGEDDLNYIGSDGTLISHDNKTDRCKVKFSDGHIMNIPFDYLQINEAMMPDGSDKEVKLITNDKGDYLMKKPGLGYTAYNRNDVCLGGFDEIKGPDGKVDDQAAIEKFLSGKINESFEYWAVSKLNEHLSRLNEAEMSDEDLIINYIQEFYNDCKHLFKDFGGLNVLGVDEMVKYYLKNDKDIIITFVTKRGPLDEVVSTMESFIDNSKYNAKIENAADEYHTYKRGPGISTYPTLRIKFMMNFNDLQNESLIEALNECLNRLNEATISDEDKRDSDHIRNMIGKLQKRSNARFTPEEQAVLDKYGITRDSWAKRLGVGDRELNPSYDGKVFNGNYYWPNKRVPTKRNGDPEKINYADRARKLKDRQFSGDTQVSGRYTPNGLINAHTQQGGHTLQDVERAAAEDRDRKPVDDMKRHLWDRKYHQDQIDGAQAEYDKSVGDARKKYDDSVRYATDTYRRHTVDAEQSRKRAQDKIDQMLRRK